MIILMDIDGVICTEEKTFERTLAKPISGAKEALAVLKAAGHEVILFSARSWAELKVTERWLAEHEIPYDGIHLGKPIADRIVDDRAVPFHDWETTLKILMAHTDSPEHFYPDDDRLLRILRNETKKFLYAISDRADLLEPILEVGPMTLSGAANSPVFQKMFDTFVDSKDLFQRMGKKYLSMDTDPSSGADYICDFSKADGTLKPESIGTAVLLSCLEHMPNVWRVPQVLRTILKPGGKAFFLTPWNLRFHGPRPDCWRISDDGYHALFDPDFQIDLIETIDCPGRPLSPVGIKCIVQKRTSIS